MQVASEYGSNSSPLSHAPPTEGTVSRAILRSTPPFNVFHQSIEMRHSEKSFPPPESLP